MFIRQTPESGHGRPMNGRPLGARSESSTQKLRHEDDIRGNDEIPSNAPGSFVAIPSVRIPKTPATGKLRLRNAKPL
jgi:hypothetical protein